jgi:hypothetical protein
MTCRLAAPAVLQCDMSLCVRNHFTATIATQMRAGTKIRFVLTLFVCTWAVAQQPTSLLLTLKDAIDLALKNNLSVLVAGTQAGEAAGSTERAFSTLLGREDNEN